MANRLGDLDHRYNFDEASGQLIDVIGAKDSTGVQGAPTYNQPTISCDTVDDAFNWNVANNPIQIGADLAVFQAVKPDEVGVVSLEWLTNDGPTNFFQFFHDESAGNYRLRTFIGPNAGLTGPAVTASRPLAVGEFVFIGVAINVTTKEARLVVKSDHPTTPLDLTNTITLPNLPAQATTGLGVSRNNANTNFYAATYKFMGTLLGEYLSVQDMQDTIDEIISPSPEDSGDLARAICLLGAGPPRTR